MRWLASNWFILVLVGCMAVMHLGHGRHGGHGGGHGGGDHRSAQDAAEPVGHGPTASDTVPSAVSPMSDTFPSSAAEDSAEKDRRSTPDDTQTRRT